MMNLLRKCKLQKLQKLIALLQSRKGCYCIIMYYAASCMLLQSCVSCTLYN